MNCLKLIFINCFFISGIAVAQTPQELRSWLPDVEGWSISEKVEVFTPLNLFDRINGSAPLFIENNFREMTAMEYNKGDDYITIQAYRHATPEDAFGMYASERSSDLSFYPVGAEAQGDDTNIYFYAGSIYVKIWASTSDNAGETLRAIAKGFADNISPDSQLPEIFFSFEKANRVAHTEAYFTGNYIGHEFLKNVYTVNYNIDGKAWQVFLIDGITEDEARDILVKYFTFTKQPQDFNQGSLLIKDRYNGDIPVVWKGKYIAGIFSENGETVDNADAIINKLLAGLK